MCIKKIFCCLVLCCCCATNTYATNSDGCNSQGKPAAHFCSDKDLERGKVDVCHVPPGCHENAHNICVYVSAVDRGNKEENHFPGAHGGDSLGTCPTPTPSPTPTPPGPNPSPTPTPPGPTPSPSPSPSPTPTPEKKVAICHVLNSEESSEDGAKAISIEVAESALQAHLDHGDQVGACVFDCAGVPFGQAAYDECNVCGGDNSTCKDCAGTVNGTKELDRCGICDGDGLSCLDCSGVPNGEAVIDACGICNGDNSTCKDCKGTPNGSAKVDLCGVCDGQNNTCLDCAGTPNGSAKVDLCGVCAGTNSTCLDCAGTPNGSAKLDKCGVCNGNGTTCEPPVCDYLDVCGVLCGDGSTCKGCDGIPGSKKVLDACGVCGGDGSSCLDCKGIPNGGTLVDACGVCAGPGANIVKFNVKKKELIELAKVIFFDKTVKYFKKGISCKPCKKKQLEKQIKKARKVFNEFVQTVHEIKNEVLVCPGTCALLENEKLIKKLKKLNKTLYTYAGKSQRLNYCPRTGPGNGGTKIISNLLDKEITECPSGKVCK